MSLPRYMSIGIAAFVGGLLVTAPIVVLSGGWQNMLDILPSTLVAMVWIGAWGGAVVWFFVQKVFRP